MASIPLGGSHHIPGAFSSNLKKKPKVRIDQKTEARRGITKEHQGLCDHRCKGYFESVEWSVAIDRFVALGLERAARFAQSEVKDIQILPLAACPTQKKSVRRSATTYYSFTSIGFHWFLA